MIDIFFLFIYLSIVVGTDSSSIGCNTHATILRQFEREGFHIDVHYLIELIVDLEEVNKWEKCSLVLRENITNSFYVNPDQLSELNRTGVSRVCTPHKVDVETPQHLSQEHTVYIYGNFQKSQNLIHSSLNFPMHLRYHKAKVSGGYSLAELKLPVLLLSCPEIECINLRKSKAPCSDCGESLCIFTRFPYKTNTNNLTLPVPVGNLNHIWFVSPVTYLLTFGGCLYLLLAIIAQKESE